MVKEIGSSATCFPTFPSSRQRTKNFIRGAIGRIPRRRSSSLIQSLNIQIFWYSWIVPCTHSSGYMQKVNLTLIRDLHFISRWKIRRISEITIPVILVACSSATSTTTASILLAQYVGRGRRRSSRRRGQ